MEGPSERFTRLAKELRDITHSPGAPPIIIAACAGDESSGYESFCVTGNIEECNGDRMATSLLQAILLSAVLPVADQLLAQLAADAAPKPLGLSREDVAHALVARLLANAAAGTMEQFRLASQDPDACSFFFRGPKAKDGG